MVEARYGSSVLTMDAEHVYRLDGKVIVGNTTLLKDMGIVDTRWYTEESRARGTFVHAATHLHDEGDLYWPDVPEAYKPFVDAWAKFRAESGFQPWKIELPIFHSCGFATTLDRIGLLNGRPVVLEIKTGTCPGWVGLQTGGQMLAARERFKAGELDIEKFPTARCAVQLSADGKYKAVSCDNPLDEQRFLTLFQAHQIRQEFAK